MKIIKLIELENGTHHFSTIEIGLHNGFSKILAYKILNPLEAVKRGLKHVEVNVELIDFEFPEELEMLRGRSLGQSSHIEYSLRDFLIKYFKKKSDKIYELLTEKEIEEINRKSLEVQMSRLDFMSKKQILSKILKTDDLYEYNKKDTKLFNDYILERNKYGHGLLCMLIPEQIFVLRHGNIYGKELYALIKNENIESFIEVGEYLLNWIFKLSHTLTTNQ